jgi:hypothetical protein
MLKPETIPILQIFVPVKRRCAVKPDAVRQIAESMLEIGQEAPILVRRDGDRFVLIEGLHRLEACKALGEQTILGFLVTSPLENRRAQSSENDDKDPIREKTERLRNLRLAKQAEETASLASKTSNEARSSEARQTGRLRGAARPKAASLSEWLATREREGFRN